MNSPCMRQVNTAIRSLLSLLFLSATLGSVAAPVRDAQLTALLTDPDPGRWCVYQEVGLMTGFQRIVIRTNGLVLGSTTGTMIAYPPPPFQEMLTPEEKRYLEMWLEVSDFMNLDLLPLGNDNETLLQVYQNGKTNLVYVNYPQFEPLVHFFLRTIPNGKDPFHSRMQRLLNLKLTAYQEAIALVKSYLKAPKRADCASEALRMLSRSMPAKDWGDFLRSCLQGASPTQRRILVEAIQSSEWNLWGRLTQDYWQQMSLALGRTDLVPLPIKLPTPSIKAHPDEGPHIEEWPLKPRPTFLAPKGTTNVAFGKKVTSSATRIHTGSLAQITDGKKETRDEDTVELAKGLQWVQIDLEKDYVIYAVLFWHHWMPMAFQDVVVQVSDDPEFKQGVQTLFSNDYENSSGLGNGTAKEYPEHYEGKLIDAKGVKARYARFYSNGSLYFRWNAYQEIEIYGLQTLDLMPLQLKLPHPFDGDPALYIPPQGRNIEKWPDEPRPPFLVPKGVTNVALHKRVTSSAPNSPEVLAHITDGNKDGAESPVDLKKGLQWVQIDLEQEYEIYVIVIWHRVWFREAFHDVIVQVSNDPEFKQGVQTLFNNDFDNSAGLGKGTDKEYPEHHEGKLIDAKGVKARYARFYSRGSTGDSWNCYQEIEIYGLPAPHDNGGKPISQNQEKLSILPADPDAAPGSFTHNPAQAELVPLPLEVPGIILNDGHFEMPTGPNIEPLPDWQKPRPPFLAPRGVTNLALGKKVTTSAPRVYGSLARITDGKKAVFMGLGTNGFEAKDGVELPKGLHWVQIDLEKEYPIYAVVLWHDCDIYTAVFHDVIIQASSDPEFKQNVQTLFNNDHDNSAGFGKGTDKEYPEWHEGKLVDTKGIKARYWRFYSNGSIYSRLNEYLEIEIFGLPD